MRTNVDGERVDRTESGVEAVQKMTRQPTQKAYGSFT